MSTSTFLNCLRETGHVRVAAPLPFAPESADALREAFGEMDRLARLEMPLDPPPLDVDAAAWAADMLYQACQFLIYRYIGPEVVKRALSRPCPSPPAPSAAWSVDLVFRYLPDLLSLARGISEGDPLVADLLRLASDWPLSSVGVKGAAGDISPFIAHPSLRRLYADRIIERQDRSRLADRRAADAVREALGLHTDLAPDLAAALDDRSALGTQHSVLSTQESHDSHR